MVSFHLQCLPVSEHCHLHSTGEAQRGGEFAEGHTGGKWKLPLWLPSFAWDSCCSERYEAGLLFLRLWLAGWEAGISILYLTSLIQSFTHPSIYPSIHPYIYLTIWLRGAYGLGKTMQINRSGNSAKCSEAEVCG